MFATQVLVHPAVAEEVRCVLSACQYARSARDYAHQVVSTLAAATHSQFSIWFDWPVHPAGVVAQTEGFGASRLLSLCARAPLLSNELDGSSGIYSIAAVPLMFRTTIAGVLAVANGARPYTPADLDLLAQAGRAALLEYESRERAEALGVPTLPQRMADLVHEVRQPLSVLEACACLLEMVVPATEARAHEQLWEMHKQLDHASGIVNEMVQGYAPRSSRPCFAEPAPEPDEGPSRVLANSAMSMVT